ncbi:hypothetical protein [Acidovorax sp. CCYZU-2555]|uniref:hypothetical protein n=1 Tax=Acidovorax sp. CCYZU-2555 TaxID=2835042 RepID=UPI001BCB2D27|nr:hypothetical protein [Acidovorax sp. CCYZU-2555]MBS7777220.1 hypothetical protein [Acidovorax sp. CCYZU-2555]
MHEDDQVSRGGAIPGADELSASALDVQIPELLAQVYEAAPTVERCHLLEPLLQPLGLLSLAAVAGGVFTNIRLRCGWHQLDVRPDDIQNVHAVDVVALVDYAQQVSVEAVDGLAQLLLSTPLLSASATAALLVAMLLRRARSRQSANAGAQEI